jgi:ribosomal protein L21
MASLLLRRLTSAPVAGVGSTTLFQHVVRPAVVAGSMSNITGTTTTTTTTSGLLMPTYHYRSFWGRKKEAPPPTPTTPPPPPPPLNEQQVSSGSNDVKSQQSVASDILQATKQTAAAQRTPTTPTPTASEGKHRSTGSELIAPTADQAFAVVLVGGKQYKVTTGDVIVTEKLEGAPVGQEITLDKVLLVGSRQYTAVGMPRLERARVVATIEEQTLAEKIIVFKKKKRKGYRRTKGHRQEISVLRIGDISLEHPNATIVHANADASTSASANVSA